MKSMFVDKGQMRLLVPETPLEAVEQLEAFILADRAMVDSEDWPQYIKSHFKICKEQIRGMEHGTTTD